MNQSMSFMFLIISINCYHIGYGHVRKGRIYGGIFDKIENVPYMAQITRYGVQVCGAAIISNQWLLTAAHCVNDAQRFSAVTGSVRRKLGGPEQTISRIIIHEKFNPKTLDNDIALIKLTEAIKFNSVQKSVSLGTTPPNVNEEVKVSGFGRRGVNAPRASHVKSTNIFVIDSSDCRDKYIKNITDNMFCANSRLSDACEGDSGGPAVIDGKLAGIISFGEYCESNGYYPGVYTKVFNYHKWISFKTGIKI